MERDKTLPDISDPKKAEEVAVKIETLASNEYSAKYKKMPTETMKANYIRDVLAALPEYYKQPALPKDPFPTTKTTANANWARYGAPLEAGAQWGRQHHLKKKYKSKSKPKSKSKSKVNTKNTRRIRRKW
jgi:hypothetical protein